MGERYVVSAQCKPPSFLVNMEGQTDVWHEWDGSESEDCWVFMVQAYRCANELRRLHV
jgi:hypothetical protein